MLFRSGFPGDDVFKPVPSLSGGERTKLALAKLILSKPNVLVMDEPTNNLDIWSIESLEEVLKEYEGCIILVSHDREFVQNVCDHFLMIDGKKLKAVSSVEEYLRRNQRNIDSTGNEYARLTFQERRRLSNKKKSVLERLQQLEVEENELSRKLEMAQLKMGLFSTDYEKLQDLYTGIERIESRLLEILQEREMLDDELDRLSETLDETS